MSNLNSIQYFIPELFLTVSILALIIIDLFLKREQKSIIAYLAAAVSLIAGFLAYQQFTLPAASLFRGMLVLDSFAIFFKILAAFSSAIVVFISLDKFRETAEYFILLLIVTLGMFIMPAVNDILMIILGMEIVGLMSYVLAGIHKTNLKSTEAALKYMIYGAVSTGIMAFGFSLVYGLTGHTNLYDIQMILASGHVNTVVMFIAFMMILAGLGYKIAMVPFHFWVPDVYEGAPTPVTAFLSVGPKAAGFALFIRFLVTVISHPSSGAAGSFVQNVHIQAPLLLAVLAVLTMTLGNFSALNQKNLKRMLGYSAIAHVGYMVMALVVFNKDAFGAIMFYMIVYLFMNFGAFWIVESLSSKLGGEDIEQYKGLGYRDSFTAVSMAVFMFSLTGLPPLAGFVGKVYLFSAVIKQGWLILALIGILNSVVSLFYYISVVKAMFLKQEDDPQPLQTGLYHKIMVAVLVVPTLVLGLYWSPVIEFTTNSIGLFFGR